MCVLLVVVVRRDFCGRAEEAASSGRCQSFCASLTLCRALTGGTALSRGRRSIGGVRGRLGHLFRFDWWVLAGERGTSVAWQCQALHVTATLVGPIVLSAKNSNHFKPKCWWFARVCLPPLPVLGAPAVVCTQARLNVASGNGCGSPGKSIHREESEVKQKPTASIQQRHARQMEKSLTQNRKQTRLVPSSSCQTRFDMKAALSNPDLCCPLKSKKE